jgi:ketosteroid isomerase-like protein
MAGQRLTTVDALELTARSYAVANGGDFGAMVAFNAPDCEWDLSRWGLGTHTGRPRIRRFLEDWIGSFAEYSIQVEQMWDLGNGVVYVESTQNARPTGARGYLQLRSASVFVWCEELAVQVTHYRDAGEARAAAERAAER